MEHKKNQGLTLIELVVTVAIIAIFTVIVVSFITSSSNEFRSTSSNAKVQMQTQETIDQIENIIIDANRGIYYAVDGSKVMNDIPSDTSVATIGSGVKQLQIFSIVPSDSAGQGDMCDVHTFTWDSGNKKMTYYYDPRPVISDSSGKLKLSNADIDTDAQPEVMNNVNDFCVDLSRVSSGKIVKFYLSTEEKGKKIVTEHTVNLRNQISVMDEGVATNPGHGNPNGETFKVMILEPLDGQVFHTGSIIKPKYQFGKDNTVSAKTPVFWTVTPNSGVTCDIVISGSDCTISNISGNGTITISVTAYGDKNMVDNASVTVQVEPDEKLDKLTVSGIDLVGAGCIYRPGQDWVATGTTNKGNTIEQDELENLEWYIDGEKIDGTYTLETNRGGDGDTEISIYAKSGDLISDEITVNIARVDIIEYVSNIIKRDEQQRLTAIYQEGESKDSLATETETINNKSVSWSLVNADGKTKRIDDKFDVQDNGEWEVTVEIKLDSSHVISDKIQFKVQILTDYRIMGPEYLVHENVYRDMYSNGFNLVSLPEDDFWHWNQFWVIAYDGTKDTVYKEVQWKIEQKDSNGVVIGSQENVTQFDVEDNAKYVTLTGRMKDGESVILQDIPVLDMKIIQPDNNSEIYKSDAQIICIAQTTAGNSLYSSKQYTWEIGNNLYVNQSSTYTWDLETEEIGNKQVKATTDVVIPHTAGGVTDPSVFTLSHVINVEIKADADYIKIVEAPSFIHIDDNQNGKTYTIDVEIKIGGTLLGEDDYGKRDLEWSLLWDNGEIIDGADIIGNDKKIHINNAGKLYSQISQGVRYAVLTAKYNNSISDSVRIAFTVGNVWVGSPQETIITGDWNGPEYVIASRFVIAAFKKSDGAEIIVKPKESNQVSNDYLTPGKLDNGIFTLTLGDEETLLDIDHIEYRYTNNDGISWKVFTVYVDN